MVETIKYDNTQRTNHMPPNSYMYDMIADAIRTSQAYEKAPKEDREQIDNWLGRNEKEAYQKRMPENGVPLYMDMIEGIVQSEAFTQTSGEGKVKVLEYLTSDRFRRVVDCLEERIANGP